jgi:hypothetical protein
MNKNEEVQAKMRQAEDDDKLSTTLAELAVAPMHFFTYVNESGNLIVGTRLVDEHKNYYYNTMINLLKGELQNEKHESAETPA